MHKIVLMFRSLILHYAHIDTHTNLSRVKFLLDEMSVDARIPVTMVTTFHQYLLSDATPPPPAALTHNRLRRGSGSFFFSIQSFHNSDENIFSPVWEDIKNFLIILSGTCSRYCLRTFV